MVNSAFAISARGRHVLFGMWTLLLFAGCVLIPVEESRFGSPTTLSFLPDHVPYATDDVFFSHEVHSSEPCETCHFGTTSEESYAAERSARQSVADGSPPLLLPSMALCFGCHDGAELSRDCITCHVTNRKERKPRFHDALWPRYHKHMAERESYKCSLCHLESDCRSCHAVRKPLSHTPRFARSTHGRMATHDRRSCATCHETSYCENCHSQPPPDHTPIFMGGGGHRQAALLRARSCLVCHNFQDSCSECHSR